MVRVRCNNGMRYGFKRPIVGLNSNHVFRARTEGVGCETLLDLRSFQVDCYRLQQNFKMAMSGIAVSNECIDAHEAQRSKKAVQYTIYKIGEPGSGCGHGHGMGHDHDHHDGEHDHEQQQQQQKSQSKKKAKEEIIVDRTCEKCCRYKADNVKDLDDDTVEQIGKEEFEKFIHSLPDNEPRYAVFDYVGRSGSSGFNDKLKFISWSPDDAPVKKKMIYSSTKDSLKKKLSINSKDVHLASKNQDEIKDAFDKLLKEN